jgi:hypothetical protein
MPRVGDTATGRGRAVHGEHVNERRTRVDIADQLLHRCDRAGRVDTDVHVAGGQAEHVRAEVRELRLRRRIVDVDGRGLARRDLVDRVDVRLNGGRQPTLRAQVLLKGVLLPGESLIRLQRGPGLLPDSLSERDIRVHAFRCSAA